MQVRLESNVVIRGEPRVIGMEERECRRDAWRGGEGELAKILAIGHVSEVDGDADDEEESNDGGGQWEMDEERATCPLAGLSK